MTDRELAGCAEVRRYYHSQDGFSTMELDSDGEYVLHSDYADLLAKYEALLSRTPSSEGEGRDGERYRRWRLLAASGTMSEAVCEMMIAARTEDDIDAAIDAASQQDGK